MATKTYSDKLKDPRWQKKRLQILNRDKFTCKLCGDTETTLNVHHLEYSNGDPWEIENYKLLTLCEHCHDEITDMKKDGYDVSINVFKSKEIKIYKSANWNNGGRIIFASLPGHFFIRIYDGKNNFITGFNFTDYWEIKSIASLLSTTIKTF